MGIIVVGNVNVDILMGRVDEWPERGTEVLLPEFEQRLGGPLGNMALAFHSLGTRARYFANVGSDGLGSQLAAELQAAGCEPEISSGPTSVTVGIVHGDGQRTFFTSPGHLEEFSLERAFRAVEEAKPGEILVVCGYFLLPVLRREAGRLLERARLRGLVTALDTGWPPGGWDAHTRAEVRQLLGDVTWFLPNDVELAGVAGAEAGPDLAAQLDLLDGDRYGTTLVKLGADGAAWLENGVLRRVPAQPVTVVDTVGAGDSFNAGFVAALRHGCSTAEAAALAVAVAGTAISTSPRRYPRWEELKVGASTER